MAGIRINLRRIYMALGFSLTIIGLILFATCYAAFGIDLSQLFLLGLVRIIAKSIERNNHDNKE
jgi:hypothetical protein